MNPQRFYHQNAGAVRIHILLHNPRTQGKSFSMSWVDPADGNLVGRKHREYISGMPVLNKQLSLPLMYCENGPLRKCCLKIILLLIWWKITLRCSDLLGSGKNYPFRIMDSLNDHMVINNYVIHLTTRMTCFIHILVIKMVVKLSQVIWWPA